MQECPQDDPFNNSDQTISDRPKSFVDDIQDVFKNYQPPMRNSLSYYEKEMVLTVMKNLEACATDGGEIEYRGDIISHTSKFCNVVESEVFKVREEYLENGRLIEPVYYGPETKQRYLRRLRKEKALSMQNRVVKEEQETDILKPVMRASRPLTKAEKEIILAVFIKTAENFLSYPLKKDIQTCASSLTSISIKTIVNLTNEFTRNGFIREPVMPCARKPNRHARKIEQDQLEHIKTIAYKYVEQEKTMDNLLDYVNDNEELPSFKKTSLYTLLRSHGITFPRKCNFKRKSNKRRKKKMVQTSSSESDTSSDESD